MKPIPTLVDRRATGAEQLISSEAHKIGEDVANYVQLTEVPLLESPSTVTVGGTPAGGGSFSEVSTTPAAGEFRVHYAGRLAGMIEFHANDAGIDVTVTYKGTGSPTAAAFYNRLSGAMLGVGRRLSEFDDLNAAITAIGATEETLLMDQASSLSAAATVPSTLTLVWPGPGNVVTLGAHNLVVNGDYEAGMFQTWDDTGAGVVTFASGGRAVRPEHWGAVRDGAANDGPALRACNDAATAAVRDIQTEPGTYLVDDTTAVGLGTGVKMFGGGTIKAGPAWDGQDPRQGVISLKTGCEAHGMIFDGAGLIGAVAAANRQGLRLVNCLLRNAARMVALLDRSDDVEIINCEIRGGGQALNSSLVDQALYGDGIYVTACERLVVDGCHIHDFTRIGVVCEGNVTDGDCVLPLVTGCRIHNGHDGTNPEFTAAIWFENCDGGQAIGNRCWDLHSASSRSAGIVASRGSTNAPYTNPRPFLIEGNYVEGCEIGIQGNDNTTIVGNTVNGAIALDVGKMERAIYLSGGQVSGGSVIISGNLFINFDLQQSADSGNSNLPDTIILLNLTNDPVVMIVDNVVQNVTYTDPACTDITVHTGAGISIEHLIVDNWQNPDGKFRIRTMAPNLVTNVTVKNCELWVDKHTRLQVTDSIRLENCHLRGAEASTPGGLGSGTSFSFGKTMRWLDCECETTHTSQQFAITTVSPTDPVWFVRGCHFRGTWNLLINSVMRTVVDNCVSHNQDGATAEAVFRCRITGGDTMHMTNCMILGAVNGGHFVQHRSTTTVAVYQSNAEDAAGDLFLNTAIPTTLHDNDRVVI